MGTRWYSTGTGRFTSRDSVFGTMGDPMTLNQYAYGGMNPATMIDPTGMGQCSMAGECVTDTDNGTKAVGGNISDPDNPYHDCSCVYTPAPPAPAPIIEYVPRPFTSPDQRAGDIDRYHKWVDHNPSIRVDKTGPSWDVSAAALASAAGGDGACSGFWGCLGHGLFVGARALVNMPMTAVGAAWATWKHADCDWEVELTVACYDMTEGAPRGGMTLGNTYITELSRSEVGVERLAHERRHSNQWMLFGGNPLLMGPQYAISEGIGYVMHPSEAACYNVFEMTAGLGDGGYGSCPSA